MMRLLRSSLLLLCAAGLFAHPMGNFSVNHYTKLEVSAHGVEIQYALDLAEIPTFELLRSWNLERSSAQAALQNRANAQAQEWIRHLTVTSNGKLVKPTFESASLAIADGAGNLPIVRITVQAHVTASGGDLAYEDHNFPDRAGWKEIVIGSEAGANLRKASQSDRDLSDALTKYPPDPTIAPPQDLRAELVWSVDHPVTFAADRPASKTGPEPVRTKQFSPALITQISQPHVSAPASAPASMTTQAAPPGAVVRGDFLSKLLHQRELTPWMMLVAIACAFALGAVHALTPGHGKTIVAAYLVGSRGTLKHAAFLGATVTFTHTVAVFALGFATLFLFRYMVPEKITEILGAVSGVCIVVVGAWMLYKRIWNSRPRHSHSHHSHDHDHHHHDGHGEHHHVAHNRSHDHGHAHHDNGHGHSHSHVPNELSWAGLVALGVSGGLVPCESALVLLLGAIALGRVGLGLLMLVSFSSGLALVLMTIGILVLYAKNLLPERKRSGNSLVFRCLSIASPAIVMMVGLIMTGVSLGWIQPGWAIG